MTRRSLLSVSQWCIVAALTVAVVLNASRTSGTATAAAFESARSRGVPFPSARAGEPTAMADGPASRSPADRADAAGGTAGEDGQSLTVDSGEVEPAVPLNLALHVRVLAAEALIEIKVAIGKRAGFPAELFLDENVTVRLSLPAGLTLHDGTLGWAGTLKGDQVVEFVARVKAVRDLDGVVEATATGYAPGGRVDADQERFRVVVSGGRPRVSLVSPPKP